MVYSWQNHHKSSPIHSRLLHRELGIRHWPTSIRSIYGDETWISNLDIVNELAGHQGCVNALSWSKSGNLLASGSDDTNLLVHRYQPEETTRPFSLATCISTGHRANIFSVKFMPHSNDRTLISCAGDHEVRVFDLEYSGASVEASNASSIAGVRSQVGRRNIASLYQGVNYLSDGSTNTKIYRSHSDRVKRIVTESSPHLFLTCSEDGEVRQFDLRLPSSAYPRQSSSRTVVFNAGSQPSGNAPPPLISYKKYRLDLNSISCSASQPHYIVLGGAHLHCFLHDRRMLGRDLTEERGSKVDSDMGTATRCVRRFAPNGKPTMNPKDPGHVTACKISDKNPNEMIASWSGDNIYGFNLIKADESEPKVDTVSRKSKESKDRKRKRSTQSGREEDVVIRMRYENGQTEDFPITQSISQRFLSQTRDSVLTEAQRRSAQIGKSVSRLRNLLFSIDHSADLSTSRPALSETLGMASSLLREMDEIMRNWRYPIDTDVAVIGFQTTLRKHRDAVRRFVQACGTLSRVLGGTVQTAGTSPLLRLFTDIRSSELEHSERDLEIVFRYNFLKAILLWLEGGKTKLAQEFSQGVCSKSAISLPPEMEEQEVARICETLESQAMAIQEHRIVSVDNSRFEIDELRMVFAKELDAAKAFTQAIMIPFSQSEPSASRMSQNRESAMKYWGLKVCRGLLMTAVKDVNFASVDRAFGGLGQSSIRADRTQEDISPEPEDPLTSARQTISMGYENEIDGDDSNDDDSNDDDDMEHHGPLVNIEDILDEIDVVEGEEIIFDDNDESPPNNDQDDEDDESSDNDDDGDDEDEQHYSDNEDSEGIFFPGAAERSTLRAHVNKDLPCNAHNRMYQGHCNVKTVKDVNYFGLDDEYVVSGCDSGHLFIWNSKTSKLLNILKGDQEVVNVVQGHPYEPTLAVSGIDHTIKIFSPDSRAQYDARKGINLGIPSNGSSGTSSLRHGLRPSTRRQNRDTLPTEDTADELSDHELGVNGLASRRRMNDSYNITSQNDVDRAGGNREAFITRDMLSQIALMMAQRRRRGGARVRGEGGDDDDDDDEGADVAGAALEDRCATM